MSPAAAILPGLSLRPSKSKEIADAAGEVLDVLHDERIVLLRRRDRADNRMTPRARDGEPVQRSLFGHASLTNARKMQTVIHTESTENNAVFVRAGLGAVQPRLETVPRAGAL
jgi:hypothetical protein